MLALPVIYSEKLVTVDRVDLHRYIGKWFTIASYSYRSVAIGHNTEIEYKLTNKGNLQVRKCFKSKVRLLKSLILHGTAFVQENTNNAKFKVQYLWPFFDVTWVIELADDYSYAVISNSNKSTLSILSRNLKMDFLTYSSILDRIKNKGFNTELLRLTPEY